MSFTWVRPEDPSSLSGRPLLDLGSGDGQTLSALVDPRGLVVAMDRRPEVLRLARAAAGRHVVAAEATLTPFADHSFACVLAADLFHHLGDAALEDVLREARRVLGPGGTVVAWWYERAGRPAPDAPQFPRAYETVAEAAGLSGLKAAPLDLTVVLEGGPPTVGFVATEEISREGGTKP